MRDIFFILFLILMYACKDSNVQRRERNQEEAPAGDKFNGYEIDGKKNGEYIRYENGKLVQRDYYLDDTICLSVFYSKEDEKPMYAQVFEHDDIERQIVFNTKEFNNDLFSLEEKEISDIEKGKRMFRYYCVSCHLNRSGDASLKKVNGDTKQLYDLINGASHPISFRKLDSIELHYLCSYIRSL